MTDLRAKIDELANLMEEFGLDRASLKGEGWSIDFDRRDPEPVMVPVERQGKSESRAPAPRTEPPQAEHGTPVTSPTTGIYYGSPSPGSPPFLAVGDVVEAGQVVGLIEAMKVFNEITSQFSGTVLKIVAENGQLVQPGDVLLILG